jgi:predicted Fe-S protein YdhL (DUF1289 family)
MIKSPCIKKCKLDKEQVVCTGCGRTKDEIATWTKMTNEAKQTTVEKAAKRLENS